MMKGSPITSERQVVFMFHGTILSFGEPGFVGLVLDSSFSLDHKNGKKSYTTYLNKTGMSQLGGVFFSFENTWAKSRWESHLPQVSGFHVFFQKPPPKPGI